MWSKRVDGRVNVIRAGSNVVVLRAEVGTENPATALPSDGGPDYVQKAFL